MLDLQRNLIEFDVITHRGSRLVRYLVPSPHLPRRTEAK